MKSAMFHLKCLASWLWFHSTLASAVVIIAITHFLCDAKTTVAVGLVTIFLGVLLAIYDRLCELVRTSDPSGPTLNVNFPPIQADAIAAFMAAKTKEQA